jgi:hypothetical protein
VPEPATVELHPGSEIVFTNPGVETPIEKRGRVVVKSAGMGAIGPRV